MILARRMGWSLPRPAGLRRRPAGSPVKRLACDSNICSIDWASGGPHEPTPARHRLRHGDPPPRARLERHRFSPERPMAAASSPWSAGSCAPRPRPSSTTPRSRSLESSRQPSSTWRLDTTPPRQLADEVVVLFAASQPTARDGPGPTGPVDAHGVAALESGQQHRVLAAPPHRPPVRPGLRPGADARELRAAHLASDRDRAAHRRDHRAPRPHHLPGPRAWCEDQQSGRRKPAQAVADVEQVMLDVGRAVDAGSLAGFATRVRQVVDPEGRTRRRQPRPRATVALHRDAPSTAWSASTALLDAEAGASCSPPRSGVRRRSGPTTAAARGQRRADALVEVCAATPSTRGDRRLQRGVRPHLLVTTPLAAVTGRTGPRLGSDRGRQSWPGPVPSPTEAARRLACDAEDHPRACSTPSSQPLDVGRSTRTVPGHLRHALVVRDRGCVAEGCDRPPAWTEAHHVVHWAEGGSTALDNLVLLCRTHHRKVHDGGLGVRRIGDTLAAGAARSGIGWATRGRRRRSADAGADPGPDQIGDPGGDPTEQQLARPGEEPRAHRDPGDQHADTEERDQRDHQRGPASGGTEQVRQQRDQRADAEGQEARDSRPSHGDGRSWMSTPSSSRTCTSSAFSGSRDSSRATSRGQLRGRARVARRSRPARARSASGRFGQLVALQLDLRLGELALRGDAHVLAGRHRGRTGDQPGQTGDARRPCCPRRLAAVPPATPAISAKLETSPSLAPKTAGRSQPPVTSRCEWWISNARSLTMTLRLLCRLRVASSGWA